MLVDPITAPTSTSLKGRPAPHQSSRMFRSPGCHPHSSRRVGHARCGRASRRRPHRWRDTRSTAPTRAGRSSHRRRPSFFVSTSLTLPGFLLPHALIRDRGVLQKMNFHRRPSQVFRQRRVLYERFRSNRALSPNTIARASCAGRGAASSRLRTPVVDAAPRRRIAGHLVRVLTSPISAAPAAAASSSALAGSSLA